VETFAFNRFVEMKQSIGWHKDKWLDIENIYISANDRGLKFGDGIFETVLIKKNNAVLIDEHIQRLENSNRVLNMNLNINKSHLKNIISLGIKKLSLKNHQLGSIRINFSRGLNKGRSIRINKNQREDYKNNLWIEFYLIKPNFSPISTFISQTEKRNQYSLINQCKTFSYNQSIQVLIEANKKLVGVNTHRANKIVADGLNKGLMNEFKSVKNVKPEFKFSSDTRFDFLCDKKIIEVKNVTLLRDEKVAEFPDAVTERGTKHLKKLIEALKQGYKPFVLFLTQIQGINNFKIAKDIDLNYYKNYLIAKKSGVKFLAYRCLLSNKEIKIEKKINIIDE